MSTGKKYKLLKDFPSYNTIVKANTEFEYDKPNDLYVSTSGHAFEKNIMENNPEWFSEITPKEWEVVAYQGRADKNTIWYKNEDGTFSMPGYIARQVENSFKDEIIYSVKRVSDSEIFSIGGEVRWDLSQLPGSSPKPFSITSFQINKLLPGQERMFCNNQNIDICYLQKLHPQQSQPKEGEEQFDDEREFHVTAVRDVRSGKVWKHEVWMCIGGNWGHGFNANTYGYVLSAKVGNRYEIYSVQRIHDGEEFVLGDLCYSIKQSDAAAFYIKKFTIIDDTIYADGCPIANLQHTKLQPQPSVQDTWTHDSVRVFLHKYAGGVTPRNFSGTWEDAMREFKGLAPERGKGIVEMVNEGGVEFQDKEGFNLVPKKERIEVTKIVNSAFSDHGNWYRFHIASVPGKPWPTIPEDKFPLIKEAIEDVLNDDTSDGGLPLPSDYMNVKEVRLLNDQKQILESQRSLLDRIYQMLLGLENFDGDQRQIFHEEMNSITDKLKQL